MRALLKTLHLIGFALFLGSIPGHIVLGQLADRASGVDAVAHFQQAKHTATLVLTLPGLGLIVASGVGLALSRRALLRSRWLQAKIALALLVLLNGALLLTPIGAEIAGRAREAAASGTLPPALAALETREGLLGAINVLMSIAIVVLAVARPRLGGPLPSAVDRPA